MTTKTEQQIIERVAIECAQETLEQAATTEPERSDLTPREPLAGDWEALADELGREPILGERAAFAAAFAAAIAERLGAYKTVDTSLSTSDQAFYLASQSAAETEWADLPLRAVGILETAHSRLPDDATIASALTLARDGEAAQAYQTLRKGGFFGEFGEGPAHPTMAEDLYGRWLTELNEMG